MSERGRIEVAIQRREGRMGDRVAVTWTMGRAERGMIRCGYGDTIELALIDLVETLGGDIWDLGVAAAEAVSRHRKG